MSDTDWRQTSLEISKSTTIKNKNKNSREVCKYSTKSSVRFLPKDTERSAYWFASLNTRLTSLSGNRWRSHLQSWTRTLKVGSIFSAICKNEKIMSPSTSNTRVNNPMCKARCISSLKAYNSRIPHVYTKNCKKLYCFLKTRSNGISRLPIQLEHRMIPIKPKGPLEKNFQGKWSICV